MNELLQTIREVHEGGQHLANWLLSHGYILLDIQSGAQGKQFNTSEGTDFGGHKFYVRRNPIYVLGRPEGVPVAPLVPGNQPKIEVKE